MQKPDADLNFSNFKASVEWFEARLVIQFGLGDEPSLARDFGRVPYLLCEGGQVASAKARTQNFR